MKNIVPIVICVLLLVGGSMLMVNGGQTATVQATAGVVAAPAPPIAQGDVAQPQPPVVQQGLETKAPIPDGLLPPKNPTEPSLQDQLAALNRVGPTCPPSGCPAVNDSTSGPVNACDAVATADREGGNRRPLRAVAQAGGGLVRSVIGHARRAERRESRRGG